MEYKLIVSHSENRFERRVQSLLENGWSFLGDLIIDNEGRYIREFIRRGGLFSSVLSQEEVDQRLTDYSTHRIITWDN